ncbi:MAG: hypothetical protein GY749_47450 [Desulfobacteraceae bacterium]|nr:hypothetical protein [Desulfobacteraceae bacterium]
MKLKNNRMNCSIISVTKNINENNKVCLTFSLLLENLGEDSQCIFWEYTKTKEPGFSLPPYIKLQSYFKKEWITLGDAIELKSSCLCIPGKDRKTTEFTIFIPTDEKKYLDGPLRIKLEGHRITTTSWDGIIAVEFSLEKQSDRKEVKP